MRAHRRSATRPDRCCRSVVAIRTSSRIRLARDGLASRLAAASTSASTRGCCASSSSVSPQTSRKRLFHRCSRPSAREHADRLEQIVERRRAHPHQRVARRRRAGPARSDPRRSAAGRHRAAAAPATRRCAPPGSSQFSSIASSAALNQRAPLGLPAGEVAALGQRGRASRIRSSTRSNSGRSASHSGLQREQPRERLVGEDQRPIRPELRDAGRKQIEHVALRPREAAEIGARLLQFLDVDRIAGHPGVADRHVDDADHPPRAADRRRRGARRDPRPISRTAAAAASGPLPPLPSTSSSPRATTSAALSPSTAET